MYVNVPLLDHIQSRLSFLPFSIQRSPKVHRSELINDEHKSWRQAIWLSIIILYNQTKQGGVTWLPI